MISALRNNIHHTEFFMLESNPKLFPEIPVDTSNAALLVIRNGNFYLSVGRLLNSLFTTLDLETQTRQSYLPKQKLGLLYLVTIFQYLERYTDEQAVEALKSRVDWKYALHLPLTNPELSEKELCDFRHWLLENPEHSTVLYILLKRLSEITQAVKKPLLYQYNLQIINQICVQNQLYLIWNDFRRVLRLLAAEYPTWMTSIFQPHWYLRYKLSASEKTFHVKNNQYIEIAQEIGRDGYYLLDELSRSNNESLQVLPEISNLKKLWEEQFEQMEDRVLWQAKACAHCHVPGNYQERNP